MDKSICAGSCGAIHGAKIANKIKMETNTAPVTPSGLWLATRRIEMAAAGTALPYLKFKFSITVNQLKIYTIGSDQPGSIRTRGQSDQHVEV